MPLTQLSAINGHQLKAEYQGLPSAHRDGETSDFFYKATVLYVYSNINKNTDSSYLF